MLYAKIETETLLYVSIKKYFRVENDIYIYFQLFAIKQN